jgi:hypothetical protein
MSVDAPTTRIRLNFGPLETVVWPVGRKGLFSSAAAGVSLVAASLVLVIGVSAMIGFRGFKSARESPTPQSVVLRAPSDDRRSGAPAPAPVVIGGKQNSSRARSARRATRRRARAASSQGSKTEVRKAPARSGLSAPASKAPAAPAGDGESRSEPTPDPTKLVPDTKTPPTTPVDQVVEDLGEVVEDVPKPVESGVGDVLLDLRDALP